MKNILIKGYLGEMSLYILIRPVLNMHCRHNKKARMKCQHNILAH